jgi:hypothetical protein
MRQPYFRLFPRSARTEDFRIELFRNELFGTSVTIVDPEDPTDPTDPGEPGLLLLRGFSKLKNVSKIKWV